MEFLVGRVILKRDSRENFPLRGGNMFSDSLGRLEVSNLWKRGGRTVFPASREKTLTYKHSQENKTQKQLRKNRRINYS